MTLFARLYVKVYILLTCDKHLHDRIITLKKGFLSFYFIMTYYLVCNNRNTTSVTSGAGAVFPSVSHEFSLVFSGVRVAHS